MDALKLCDRLIGGVLVVGGLLVAVAWVASLTSGQPSTPAKPTVPSYYVEGEAEVATALGNPSTLEFRGIEDGREGARCGEYRTNYSIMGGGWKQFVVVRGRASLDSDDLSRVEQGDFNLKYAHYCM